MPTFTRLREKHPDAEMKWFARGKLWESPEEVRADTEKRRGGFAREGAPATNPPDRSRHRDRPEGPPRNRDWRPGGEHKDPRQQYKDAKKAKNIAGRREKFARKHGDGDRFQKPGGTDAPPRRDSKESREKPQGGSFRPPPRDDARPPYDRNRPGPPKREWDRPREAGSAPPKRDWSKPRDGYRPRDEYRARDERDRRDAPPRRDDARPPSDRNRPGPPKREWDRPREAGSAPPKRDWSKPRDGGPKREWTRDKPQGDRFRPPPSDEYRARDERDRRDAPPRRDDARPPYDRNRLGAPASPKRAWERPREGAPVPPKRDWDRPRDGGPVPPKRDWDRPRDGGRPFQRKGFERNQGTEEPQAPPKPRGPNREPRPSESPEPGKPPRPTEPVVPPPGPPERGRRADGFDRPRPGRLNKSKRRP